MPKIPENGKNNNKKNAGNRSKKMPAVDGSELLDVRTSSRCKVCQSKYRVNVDMMLIRGFSVRKIAENLQAVGEDITYRSVQRHKESHLDLDKSAYRAIIEKHAEEYEKANAENEIRIISGKAYLDVFIQKGWDQIIYEDLRVEPKDVIKAIELREELMSGGYSVLEEKMMVQVKSMVQAIREIVPPELHGDIAARAKEIASGENLMLDAEANKTSMGEPEDVPQSLGDYEEIVTVEGEVTDDGSEQYDQSL
jgi:hypothetical protein